MQIHELTQPRKSKLDEIEMFGPGGLASEIGSAIRNPAQALGFTKDGKFSPGLAQKQADQAEYARRAAKAAGKIQAQLPDPTKPPTLDQAVAKLKANPAAQQWIDGVAANWPAQAKNLAQSTRTVQDIKEGPLSDRAKQRSLNTNTAKTTATTTAPNPFASTVSNLATPTDTGLTPDPTVKSSSGGNLTTTATGQTHVASPVNTNLYADQFRTWVNSQLKTTSLEKLETDPKVKAILEPLLQQIVAARNNPQAQQKLVHDFFSYAVAANHVVQAKNPGQNQTNRSNFATGSPITGDQNAVDTGLNRGQLLTLKQMARDAGGPVPRTTGNDFFDSLIAQIRGV
jgi:hypothetical protein